MTSNKLKRNDDKTECLLIVSSRTSLPNPHPTSIHIGDTDILFFFQAKNLGATLTICPRRSMSPTSADLLTYKFGELVTSVTISLLMLQKPSSVPLFCQNLTTVILFYQVLQNIFLTNSKRSKILQPDLSSKLASMKTRQKRPWLPIVSRIQYKVATLCYNSFTESYPVYLSNSPDCLPSIQTISLHF